MLFDLPDHDTLYRALIDRDHEPGRVWSEDHLMTLGYDPGTVRRTFKRHLGLTFLDMARLRRAGRG